MREKAGKADQITEVRNEKSKTEEMSVGESGRKMGLNLTAV